MLKLSNDARLARELIKFAAAWIVKEAQVANQGQAQRTYLSNPGMGAGQIANMGMSGTTPAAPAAPAVPAGTISAATSLLGKMPGLIRTPFQNAFNQSLKTSGLNNSVVNLLNYLRKE